MHYPSIRIEGAILSSDILDRLEDAPGQRPVEFGLESTVRVKDEIARAWADAQDYWRIFQRRLDTLRSDSPATTETRQQWMVPLLGLLGYQLDYQSRGVEVNDKLYAISHRVTNRGNTPLHIIGCREPAGLDRKPAKAVLRMSAHAMVQEYLNLQDELYGLVSNGRVLRVLRDSSRLVKLTYLEFDLDRIFIDGLFADFAVCYRLLHASRLPQTIDTASSCWLERYHQDSLEQVTRIRAGLRLAVIEALEIFGTGFLAHPDNTVLREQVAQGILRPEAYFNSLLRLVYRLLFLMVIEERGLVFPGDTPRTKMQLYYDYYSVQRLRRLALQRGLKVGRFHDAWLSLVATFHLFECPETAAQLGTSALGGELFHPKALGPLRQCRLSNAAFLAGLERLCYFTAPQSNQRLPVNFGALATEEFGSVYESLLELHPLIDTAPAPRFGFRQGAGNERKTSGSYYTPASLVDCLLNSAVDPVLEERINNYSALGYPDAASAVLALKVCDPACGSGHFLIAAAQRLARRLATLRAGGEEPGPELLRHSLRDVIGHCIHGVDINPMAVELCKVGLWLEAVEPGKPLTFLDHHIKCGNSLLGATPVAIQAGIPDKAYEPLTGDTKEAARWMRKLNQEARNGQGHFDFAQAMPWERLGNLPAAMAGLETLDDDTPAALAAKERRYREIVEGSSYESARLLHDTWCAAFVWPRDSTKYGTELTTEHLRKIERNPHSIAPHLKARVRALARQYRFFHWHIEFPAVFGAAGDGGFDVMLGNPPWERVKLQEKEFFAERSTEIANAPNAAVRRRFIAGLATRNPALLAEFHTAQRQAEGESHLMRHSGRYPLCGRGDINVYTVFAEGMRTLLNDRGRAGCVLPTGIATDDTTKFFFQEVIETQSLVSLFDFENKGIFSAVDSRMKFCLFTSGRGLRPTAEAAEFVFFAHAVEDLRDPERRFTLSAADIELLNPNTRTCPIFRSRRDAELTKAIYRRVPVLIREARDGRPEENPWGIKFSTMFHMSNDSHLFRTREQLEADDWRLEGNIFCKDGEAYLPLYEAKMIHHFDHRWATYEGLDTRDLTLAEKQEPARVVLGRYWVPYDEVLCTMAHVPKALVQAYRAKHTEILAQIVMLWLAGYHLNHGHEALGEALLLRYGNEGSDSITQVLGQWSNVQAMEQAFPLTADDLVFIESHLLEELCFLRVALYLLETHTPRWFLGWRDICRSTDERTAISSVWPRYAAGDTFLQMFPSAEPKESAFLVACLDSLVQDYAARQKIGGTHLKYHYFKQLPILHPSGHTQQRLWLDNSAALLDWLLPRVLELTYTAWDLQPFAHDCGWFGPPFRWDEERRFLLRCELDAAFFHLYLPAEKSGDWRPADGETAADLARLKASFPTPRDAVAYIMDTFPIVKRKDETAHGEYRTQRVILDIYDTMQQAVATGKPYRTRLDPPPADPGVAHPPRGKDGSSV